MRRWLVLGTLAAGVLFSACGARDPDGELRALIDAAASAAESRDTGFFRDVISTDYIDRDGRRRDDIVDRLRAYFFVNASIEVVNRIDSIELFGEDAAAVVLQSAVMGRGRGSSMLGVDGDLYRIELELVREGGEWRVIGADWESWLR